MNMAANEAQELRLEMLHMLLTAPHSERCDLVALHAEVLDCDPLFYGHLAAWYQRNGSVRDHMEVFVGNLLASPCQEHRGAGFVMLQRFAPDQVVRVIDDMKLEHKKVPRSTRTAVTQYLRHREADDARFDHAALRHRKALKRLYATLHIRPGERADAVLFKNKPPAGSLAAKLKKIARTTSPTKQALLIARYKIPFTIAVGAIRRMTSPVLIALIDAMTRQELDDNLRVIERYGAFESDAVKKLVRSKLVIEPRAGKRAAMMRGRGVAEAADEQTGQITDTPLQAKVRIRRATALLVDKSSSMESAIHVGKRLAAMLSAVMEAPLFVWAFDSMPYPIEATSPELAGWEAAFDGVRASGVTSVGAPLEAMRLRGQCVEQILVVTDGGENTAPYFKDVYASYCRAMEVSPEVVLIKVGDTSEGAPRSLEEARVGVSVFPFEGGDDALSDLIPMLTSSSRLELLFEVMSCRLPVRRCATRAGEVRRC